MGADKSVNITLDRDRPGHTGTGIVMIRVRARLPGEVTRASEIHPGWIVDIDSNGALVDIEILSPEKHFPQSILDILPDEFPER